MVCLLHSSTSIMCQKLFLHPSDSPFTQFSLVYFAGDGPELGLSKLSTGVSQHLVSLRELGEGGGAQGRHVPGPLRGPDVATQSRPETGQHWPH